MKKNLLFFLLISLAGSFGGFQARAAQEFRSFNAIPTPGADQAIAADLSAEGYRPVNGAQNLPVDLVEKVVYDLFAAWNSPNLDAKLSRNLPNKSRIVDSIRSAVPRYVRLQVLAIQNPRIVEQYIRYHPDGDGSFQVLSKVSVRVTSQAAASTSVLKKFSRTEGTSEYLINITQKVRAV